MTPEETKVYLLLFACTCNANNIMADGADGVSVGLMRRVLKRLILRGEYVECALCHCPITNAADLSLDHIVPHSLGGSDYLYNMQPAHRRCNEAKGNMVTDADIDAACQDAKDSKAEIIERKKRRKESKKKKRYVKRLKPWQINNNGGNSR